MWLFAVRGKTRPGASEEFAQKWQEVYSARFPQMAGFIRASIAADRATDSWLALAFWGTRPDEAQLAQAIEALGAQIGSLLSGPPDAEWLEVLQEI